MAKKNSDTAHLHSPDYDQLTTVGAVDREIARYKDFLVVKVRQESRIKEEKKTYVSAMNENLKELREELDHAVEVLERLDQCRQVVHVQEASVVPLAKTGTR